MYSGPYTVELWVVAASGVDSIEERGVWQGRDVGMECEERDEKQEKGKERERERERERVRGYVCEWHSGRGEGEGGLVWVVVVDT